MSFLQGHQQGDVGKQAWQAAPNLPLLEWDFGIKLDYGHIFSVDTGCSQNQKVCLMDYVEELTKR